MSVGGTVLVLLLLLGAQSNLTAEELRQSEGMIESNDIKYLLQSEGRAGRDMSAAEQKLLQAPRESEDAIVASLVKLANPGKSRRGRKYRSLVCALSRNDVHLREYVVRNLLAGFGHIVIYDNNQVGPLHARLVIVRRTDVELLAPCRCRRSARARITTRPPCWRPSCVPGW
jgi:hypothetical protein